MGSNQAVGNERRKGEQVSVSDPSPRSEIDGNWRGSCVCESSSGGRVVCGDKEQEHAPNDLWRELLPGSVG